MVQDAPFQISASGRFVEPSSGYMKPTPTQLAALGQDTPVRSMFVPAKRGVETTLQLLPFQVSTSAGVGSASPTAIQLVGLLQDTPLRMFR